MKGVQLGRLCLCFYKSKDHPYPKKHGNPSIFRCSNTTEWFVFIGPFMLEFVWCTKGRQGIPMRRRGYFDAVSGALKFKTEDWL